MSNIDSFKELLLKKSTSNELKSIIPMLKDEVLISKMLESLEKMARPQASMGRSANAAVTSYGNQMKNKDVEQMRDALSHHVNHHRAALKAGNREVADQHMNKIVPMMHLAARAGAHSGGQLGLDYTPTEPWETNYTTPERRAETGKLKEGTKGLRRRLNPNASKDNPRAVRDYRYLEMPPHEEHADSAKSPHKGGYPFEEIQLGNPAKIDAKEAYLNLQDVDPQDKFTPHPFDEHPIHSFAEDKQDSLSPEEMNDFATKMQDWHGSEHNAKWMQSLKDAHAKDPEAFKNRGKTKPGHHFEGIPLQEQPHKKQAAQGGADMSALPPALAAKFASQQQAPTQVPPAGAPQPQAKGALAPEQMAALPPALRAKFGGGK
jgi:hypothetical protein